MSYINLSGDIYLEKISSKVPTKCAKIMSCVKKINNTTANTFTTMVFRIYHGLSKMVLKEYFVAVNKNDNILYDLTPDVNDNARCFLVVNGDNVDIYFKPTQTYNSTVIQFIQTPQTECFFDVYDCAKYEYDESLITGTKIEATVERPKVETSNITYKNSWVNYSSSGVSYIEKTQGMVSISIDMKRGVKTDDTLVFTVPSGFRPKKTIRIPLSCWNGVTWSLIGTIILSPLGEAKIYGISSFNAVRVLGNVTYVI